MSKKMSICIFSPRRLVCKLVTLLFITLVSLPGWSERPWIIPPAPDADPAFDLILDEIRSGQPELAIELYLQYAAEHPRSELGAESLFAAADITGSHLDDKAGADLILEQLIEEYNGSRFEIFARASLLERAIYNAPPASQLAEFSLFCQGFGAPSLESILSESEPESLLVQIAGLHPEVRLGLARVHLTMFYLLLNDDRVDDALTVAHYGRQAFDPVFVEDEHFRLEFESNLAAAAGVPVSEFGRKNLPPVISQLFPPNGTSVSQGANLSLQVSTGSFRNAAVDLASIELTLDGIERTYEIAITSEINRTLSDSADYEVLTLTLPAALPVGNHTAAFRVSANRSKDNPNDPPLQAEATWSFTVIDDGGGEDKVLTSAQDTILRAQKKNRNEGANPLLMLSHRPEIRNKSNNPLVGFDLTNVDLNGLTSAKLVMNIQECDIPKRWGKNGRFIITQPVNQPWVEGNGKQLKVKGQKTRGDGQGATWFSPIDEDIGNKRPNGSLQWMGARPFLGPVTAPPVKVVNKQTGPIEFDVTADVQAGFQDGWMLRKQDESKFGNIRFYSKEGAAEVGNPDLAPKLILEYGGQSADTGLSKGLLASSGKHYLRAITRNSERPSLKDVLQDNAAAAYAGQVALTSMVSKSPITRTVVQTAYRSWLNDSLTLANLPQPTT